MFDKAVTTPGPENREFTRRRALRSGRLLWQNRSCSLDCVIRDQSDGGVRIRVAAISQLPREVELHLPTDMQVRPCEVRWQRGQEVGLRFSGPAAPLEA